MSPGPAAGMYGRARRNPRRAGHKGDPMSNDRAADEAAIQSVMAASYKAWEAGDADGMVADYTEDATAVLPGSLRDGRDAIRDSMAQGFAGPLKGTATSNERLGIRFVGR